MRKLQFAACHPERRTVGSKSRDLLWILALAFTMALVACGDDKGSSPEGLPDEVANMDELEEYKCDDSVIGEIVYVKSKSKNYECDGDEWSVSQNQSKSSSSAKSSSSKKSSSSTKSSSSKKSSSSSANSSSSGKSSSSAKSLKNVTLAKPCKLNGKDNCEYGSITDARDCRTYKTVKIGDQWWMAENLSFKTDSSACIGLMQSYCAKYGLVYSWSNAMDSAGIFSKNGVGCGYRKNCEPTYPVRGICPEGWHLPEKSEFETLLAAIDVYDRDYSGLTLRQSTEWTDASFKDYLKERWDEFGFSVLPAGYSYEGNRYNSDEGRAAYLITSTEYDKDSVYSLLIHRDSFDAYFKLMRKYRWLSIRCIKDDHPPVSLSVLDSAQCRDRLAEKYSDKWNWNYSKDVFLNPKIAYDSIIDERDNKVYKTIKIGNQTWMAENLNYADSSKAEGLKGRSWCYDGKSENCNVTGRLYTWAAVMDSAGTFSKNSKNCGVGKRCLQTFPMQGICPSGWHVPMEAEWDSLYRAIKVESGRKGYILKSQIGWKSYGYTANGIDSVGFSAIPAGGKFDDGFKQIGEYSYFWTATENGKNDASGKYFYYNSTSTFTKQDLNKDVGLSLRCVKNSDSYSPGSDYVPYDHSECLADNWSIDQSVYKQFTDPRNGRSYYYYTATSHKTGHSVTVMAENLNIGEMILGDDDQSDDTKIERYCYNNDTTNCDKYGGLYQWAEMMQFPSRCNTESCSDWIERDHQGICPEGWRLFTWDDFEIVSDFYDKYGEGIPRGLRSGCLGGKNTSGFALIGTGKRTIDGEFEGLKESTYWLYPEEYKDDGAEYAYAAFFTTGSNDNTGNHRNRGAEKLGGRPVRCTKLKE